MTVINSHIIIKDNDKDKDDEYNALNKDKKHLKIYLKNRVYGDDHF